MSQQSDTPSVRPVDAPRQLPLDLLLVLRDNLTQDDQQAAIANLACASRQFHDIFTPAINYEKLKIGRKNADKVFWGLTGMPTSSTLELQQSGGRTAILDVEDMSVEVVAKKTKAKDVPKDEPRRPDVSPNSTTHERKLADLNRCTHLELVDLPALHRLIDAAEAVKPASVMPNVTHLCLGEPLMYSLGMAVDQHHHPTIVKLCNLIYPRHLCAGYAIRSRHEFLNRKFEIEPAGTIIDEEMLEWWEVNDHIWSFQVANGITDIVNTFERRWSLESITCHGVSIQSLPAIDYASHRIFFARVPLPAESKLAIESLFDERARHIADAICLLGAPDEGHYEFVGAGYDFSKSSEMTKQCEWMGLRELQELIPKQLNSHNLWEIIVPQVKFTPWSEAAPCVCCGER